MVISIFCIFSLIYIDFFFRFKLEPTGWKSWAGPGWAGLAGWAGRYISCLGSTVHECWICFDLKKSESSTVFIFFLIVIHHPYGTIIRRYVLEQKIRCASTKSKKFPWIIIYSTIRKNQIHKAFFFWQYNSIYLC